MGVCRHENGNTGLFESYWERMVKAALVMEAGRLSSFATALHAFFFMTCQGVCVGVCVGVEEREREREEGGMMRPRLHTDKYTRQVC